MSEPASAVLDSYAILALLADEPGAEAVAAHLRAAAEREVRLLLNQISLGEIWYIVARSHGAARAERVLDHLDTLPIDVVENDRERVLDAARIKARHRMSYADAFAAATALRSGLPLITGDREFETMTDEIEIVWI